VVQPLNIEKFLDSIQNNKNNSQSRSELISLISEGGISEWHDPVDHRHPMVITARNYFAYALENPNFFIILFKSMGEIGNKRSEFIKELFKRQIKKNKLDIIVQNDIDTNILKNYHSEHIIVFVLGALHHFVFYMLSHKKDDELEKISLMAADLIVRGILPPRTAP
jgi:hypothetical protein